MKKFALIIALLGLWWIKAVYAADFFGSAGDVQCLIASINEANRNFQQNTINLEAGIYTLTTIDNGSGGFPGEGANGLPLITGRMTLRGQGNSLTTIERDSAAPKFRILRIEPTGVLTLESLALRGGGGLGAVGPGGGVIYNLGRLSIDETDISEGFLAIATRGGGGILNQGNLAVRSSRIFDNTTADAFGGGDF
jgi:hypothetical protein